MTAQTSGKKQRLTPKQRVQRTWPKAKAAVEGYSIWQDYQLLGYGLTESAAWADAARRLK